MDDYTNDYLSVEGGAAGVFWKNGTDDILVGVTTITQSMADDCLYGQLDIYSNDPDLSGEISEGLTNRATIFFRI